MDVTKFAEEHPEDVKILENGKLQFNATGMDFPSTTERSVLEAYLNGRAMRRVASRDYDYAKHEPYLVPHNDRDDKFFLYCTLTKKTVPRIPTKVDQHVSGKRYQRLKADVERKKEEAEIKRLQQYEQKLARINARKKKLAEGTDADAEGDSEKKKKNKKKEAKLALKQKIKEEKRIKKEQQRAKDENDSNMNDADADADGQSQEDEDDNDDVTATIDALLSDSEDEEGADKDDEDMEDAVEGESGNDDDDDDDDDDVDMDKLERVSAKTNLKKAKLNGKAATKQKKSAKVAKKAKNIEKVKNGANVIAEKKSPSSAKPKKSASPSTSIIGKRSRTAGSVPKKVLQARQRRKSLTSED